MSTPRYWPLRCMLTPESGNGYDTSVWQRGPALHTQA